MIIHVVKPGENLHSISRLYDTTPEKIIYDNELNEPNRLVVGQTIVITNGNDEEKREVLINGYAYPNIKEEVLSRALPYLTNITPFSYGFNLDGSLIPLDDQALIDTAIENDVAPIMLLTTMEEDGSFNSVKAGMMLKDEAAQNTLIENIIETLQEKNYSGIDVDIEYLSMEDRDNFSNFIKKLADALHPLGYKITVALAAKASDNEEGLLFEGHDYAALGQYADNLLLMTYEWGYAYGPPLPVSPIYRARDVLDYAVTQIPSEKLLIGIPNYGYDWTLPFVEGTAAKPVNNVSAVDLARDTGAVIEYDEEAQAPFFNYYDVDGNQHIVWFEDARSIEAKLSLIEEYNLSGASYWTIMSKFPQNWLVLDSMYDVEKVLNGNNLV